MSALFAKPIDVDLFARQACDDRQVVAMLESDLAAHPNAVYIASLAWSLDQPTIYLVFEDTLSRGYFFDMPGADGGGWS